MAIVREYPAPDLCHTTDTNWSAFPWHCSSVHTLPDVSRHFFWRGTHWFSPLLSCYCEQCPPSGPCHHQSDSSLTYSQVTSQHMSPFFTLNTMISSTRFTITKWLSQFRSQMSDQWIFEFLIPTWNSMISQPDIPSSDWVVVQEFKMTKLLTMAHRAIISSLGHKPKALSKGDHILRFGRISIPTATVTNLHNAQSYH